MLPSARKRNTAVRLTVVAVVFIATVAHARTHPAPRDMGARADHPTGQDEFAKLRERPVTLPALGPGGACPVAPEGREISADFAAAVGPGPVYPVGLSWPQGATIYPWDGAIVDGEWSTVKVLWVADPGRRGRVLIRGQQIDGDEVFRFSGGPQRLGPELLWPETPGRQGVPATASGHRQLPSYTYVRRPGCYAYQIDGEDFGYQIVVRVADRGEPRPGIGEPPR